MRLHGQSAAAQKEILFQPTRKKTGTVLAIYKTNEKDRMTAATPPATNTPEWRNTMKINKLRMLANDKGFTLIELMIVIAIIGILAAVAIPNFIEYKNKSYCTATVNDVNAIGGALADYFANPANVTATTTYNPAASGDRPFITVGTNSAGTPSNTLLLSASTAQGISGVAEAAGAIKVGSSYVIYAIEGAGNCPLKITEADNHWIDPSGITPGVGGSITPNKRAAMPSAVAYIKTM